MDDKVEQKLSRWEHRLQFLRTVAGILAAIVSFLTFLKVFGFL